MQNGKKTKPENLGLKSRLNSGLGLPGFRVQSNHIG